jgi:serine/threonine protein kinase
MSAIEDENRDPLEVLAAEFIERHRGGEHPAISEYVAQHPELAVEIEELFPTIAAMEQLKAHREGSQSGQASLGAVRLERLGDFRILGEIGRGGMGIVYEAFQESLGRHVAVKVLPRQSLLDPKQLQRFHREAQTAARLHHTNIVPLFGVGEQEGFHYIVMQLIRGVSLDAVLAKLQQLRVRGAGGPSGRDPAAPPAGTEFTGEALRLARVLVEGKFWQSGEFAFSSDNGVKSGPASEEPAAAARESPASVATAATEHCEGDRETEVSGTPRAAADASSPAPARLEPCRFKAAYWRSVAVIGMQVADALHYAHAHHTLHRDIKPANLLLDSQGVVWITDFGLAKAMDQDQASQTVALAGTLRYMAPEQFSGRFDTRSDLYSLGLTLYELLTLRPAFADASRSGLIRKINQFEPARPRKLDPAIPRDLETVVLKAIAREPTHRYQSAAELAHDLQRFLEDRPIAARRASPVERLWRWSRRNRAVASLAASTFVLLILFAVVTSAGYVRTARQREKAEATSALALEALDKIFQQFAPERTAPASGLLVVGDTGEEITVPAQPVLSKEAAALLEHMLKFYDRLAAQGGDDARLRRKVAEANRRVGDIRQRLGHFEESKAAYLRAIESYTRLSEASPEDTELRTEIARIHNEIGSVYWATNEPAAGQASYSSALATLNAAPAESSISPQYRYELARTCYFLGKRPGGQPGPYPLAPGGRRGPRPGASGFPFAAAGPRRPPHGRGESEASFPPGPPPEPHEPPKGEAGMPPGPPNSARGPAPGSRPLFPFMDPREREENLKKAVDLLERLVSEHPAAADYRHLLARCYREAGTSWFGRGPKSPSDSANKAVKILEKLVEEYPDVSDYRYDLSQSYIWLVPGWPFSSGAADQAAKQRTREMLEKALAISDELVSEHPNIPDYAVSQVHIRLRLADFLWESDPTRAEASLRKALEVQSTLARRFPQNSFYRLGMAIIHESLAAFLQQRGGLPEARSALENAIASFKEVLQKDPKVGSLRGVLAHNYANLADLLRRMGDEPAAAEAERKAHELRSSGH